MNVYQPVSVSALAWRSMLRLAIPLSGFATPAGHAPPSWFAVSMSVPVFVSRVSAVPEVESLKSTSTRVLALHPPIRGRGFRKTVLFLSITIKNSTVFRDPLPKIGACRAGTLVDTSFNLSTFGSFLTLDSNTGALIDTANHDGGGMAGGCGKP